MRSYSKKLCLLYQKREEVDMIGMNKEISNVIIFVFSDKLRQFTTKMLPAMKALV